MKPIPCTPQTLAVARKIVWFEPPEKALADPVCFMAYAMTYALPEDMRFIRKYVSDDDFRDALDHAPAGIIDPRSWAYWNSKMGRYPPPPQPVRRFEGVGPTGDNSDVEAQRRYGVRAWLRMRQESPKLDPEEARRRAAEKWRAEFGPENKD
ncbi:MAG: hypothetical protein ACREU6_05710 [Steroidobacteraceae bacterium]